MMKRDKFLSQSQGNATIYVLIVVALFAALAMIVARQNNGTESNRLSRDRANIIATQVLSYPYQVRQSILMMMDTGTDASDLDFTMAGQPDFETTPLVDKVFHPEGGGLVRASMPGDAIVDTAVTPAAGWYLGMFNNIEWSETAAPDVILVGWPLKLEICEAINTTLTGDPTPRPLNNTIPNIFINREYPTGHSIHGGANDDLDIGVCATCEDLPSACVVDTSGRYGVYSLMVNR